METARDEHVYSAKLAEQAERYDEMVESIKKVAVTSVELTVEERNLLSVAYKNVIGARSASWRTIAAHEQREDSLERTMKEEAHRYRMTIEKELTEQCNDILNLLENHLIPHAQSAESKVFLHKMKGDYHRYLVDFATGKPRAETVEKSLKAYRKADEEAEDLPSTNPIRLSLALNFSVFCYEILNSPDKAFAVAKKAYDDGIVELDALYEDSHKDGMLMMQLLRDNLTLWTADSQEDVKEGDDKLLEDQD